MVWASPRSLATTWGITFVFFSSAYLDVSVQQVTFPEGMILIGSGCPIRKSADQMLFGASPQLIAAYHVLHRL
jgi:hypothetical protein